MKDKEKYYDTIAQEFDSVINQYDTNRRIEVIFDDFLAEEDLTNKTVLDAGCGTGWFTQQAMARGASVFSLDIGENLIRINQRKNPLTKGIVGSILDLPFWDSSFDYVISSDVIEHTRNPYHATEELIRVLKPQGILCITVPNKSFWYFSVVLANYFRLRKYQGFENWVYYPEYKTFLQNKKVDILEFKGVHLYPFVVNSLNGILRKLDKRFENKLARVMVNIAVKVRKK